MVGNVMWDLIQPLDDVVAEQIRCGKTLPLSGVDFAYLRTEISA